MLFTPVSVTTAVCLCAYKYPVITVILYLSIGEGATIAGDDLKSIRS